MAAAQELLADAATELERGRSARAVERRAISLSRVYSATGVDAGVAELLVDAARFGRRQAPELERQPIKARRAVERQGARGGVGGDLGLGPGAHAFARAEQMFDQRLGIGFSDRFERKREAPVALAFVLGR